MIVVAAPKPTTTGPTPPNGKKPKGFHPRAMITSGTDTFSHETHIHRDWTVAGIAIGIAAVILAAVAFFLLRRRRRPAG